MFRSFAAAALVATCTQALMVPEQDGLFIRNGENTYKDQWGKEYQFEKFSYDLGYEIDGDWKFDGENLHRIGDLAAIPGTNEQQWFSARRNWCMENKECYIEVHGSCWDDKENYWFGCIDRACDWYREQSSCKQRCMERGGEFCEYMDSGRGDDRGDDHRDQMRDIERMVENVLEDWAESTYDANRDLIDSISADSRRLVGNVVTNTTAMLNQTVTEGFEQMLNQTGQYLNETRSQVNETIYETNEDIMRELDLDMALLSAVETEESNGSLFGIAAVSAVATFAGLFVARAKCGKNDEDFQRV